MQRFSILFQCEKMLVFYCKEFLFPEEIIRKYAIHFCCSYMCYTSTRYENSKMSADQISQLVTRNLEAVGLKVPIILNT